MLNKNYRGVIEKLLVVELEVDMVMLLIPFGEVICVLIHSFFKEMIDTTGFSWKDILAAYQATTNWSSFVDKIKGISEMPTE